MVNETTYNEFVTLLHSYSAIWLNELLTIKAGSSGNDALKKELVTYLSTGLSGLVTHKNVRDRMFGRLRDAEIYHRLIDHWVYVNLNSSPEKMRQLCDNFDRTFVDITYKEVISVREKYPFLVLHPALRKEGLIKLISNIP